MYNVAGNIATPLGFLLRRSIISTHLKNNRFDIIHALRYSVCDNYNKEKVETDIGDAIVGFYTIVLNRKDNRR